MPSRWERLLEFDQRVNERVFGGNPWSWEGTATWLKVVSALVGVLVFGMLVALAAAGEVSGAPVFGMVIGLVLGLIVRHYRLR